MRLRLLILAFTLVGFSALGKSVPEYPPQKVRELLKKIQKEKKICYQSEIPEMRKPSVCRSKKLLLAMEGLLQSYLTVQAHAEAEVAKEKALEDKNNYLLKESEALKANFKDTQGPKLPSAIRCYKSSLLQDLLLSLGIPENGSSVYSKRPIPGGEGVCWTNSKKKKEASVNLCNYPLAISVETRGQSFKRNKEYLFSLNGCDLVSVTSTDNFPKGSRATFITYDQCLFQWNKRTADAAMSSSEVALMEDTIGFCFREHLLPPRTDHNGRKNPLIRKPANLTSSGPK
jgi:hypothetical protein